MAARRRRRVVAWGAVAVVAIAGAAVFTDNPLRREVVARMSTHTVESRVAEFGARVDALWRERCAKAGVAYPPSSVAIVVLKREKQLRVIARRGDGACVTLATYPVLAASGEIGPKLREGDRQVPEGVYGVEALNPNSRFHLALRLGYPNDEDRRIGASEGRAALGGDIMIHGGSASIGCVAIGDEAIEEVFVLAARAGVRGVEVVLCPSADPRGEVGAGTPGWVSERYGVLADRLGEMGVGP